LHRSGLQHENLHIVPDDVTDREACFAEPLAAACRIREQQVPGFLLPQLGVHNFKRMCSLCTHPTASLFAVTESWAF
jgi:hypothetical protein